MPGRPLCYSRTSKSETTSDSEGLALKLAAIDYVILSLYFAFVLGIGWMLRKKISTSGDFLTSGHSVPVWITSLAFLAANLGAQELVGMSGNGAKYGIMTAHFYWVGALRAGISQAALRRKNARLERPQLRRHDHLLLRHLHVRPRAAAETGAGVEFHHFRALLGGDRSGLYVPGRPHQCDLQRSAAVLPDRVRLHAAQRHGGHESGRMERRRLATSPGDDAQLEVHRSHQRKPHGNR